ncbi:MAG: aromatic compound degradation protein PaaI [Pseudonocardia sp. SCN 72-86]|nr:MAG: aromatic compound degradation protein PaaI [Pseudonocardia sp. SCN 72-86]
MSAQPDGPVRSRTYEWGDPSVSAAAARVDDGLTFLRRIVAGELPAPPIVDTLGITLVSVDVGRVEFALEPAEFHYNPIGSVHGGVYATLLDSAAACAVQSRLPAGAYYTSLDLTVKFLRPITDATGPVRCVGEVLQLGGRTALAQSQLLDGDDRLLAHATSSCMIFRPSAA